MWAGWVQQLECTLRVHVCVRLLKNYAVYAPSRLDLLYYLSFYACCNLVHEIGFFVVVVVVGGGGGFVLLGFFFCFFFVLSFFLLLFASHT